MAAEPGARRVVPGEQGLFLLRRPALVQPVEDWFRIGRGLIYLAKRDDAFHEGAEVLLFPELVRPLGRVDALQHESGGGADEAIFVAEEPPDVIHVRLHAGADYGFA